MTAWVGRLLMSAIATLLVLVYNDEEWPASLQSVPENFEGKNYRLHDRSRVEQLSSQKQRVWAQGERLGGQRGRPDDSPRVGNRTKKKKTLASKS